ncbi:MAG: agmatinase [SAR324 cluster bacterium]|nr:agmatinase [SAR324 cluster bacterium]
MEMPEAPFAPFPFENSIFSNTTHLIGFEFDGTACYRKGAKDGPNEIRMNSLGIETYSPYQDLDTEDICCVDLGNLPVGKGADVQENWWQASEYFLNCTKGLNFPGEGIRFLTMGGEHSIAYAPIVTYLEQYPDLLVIQLDAHADLRDGYEGYHFSHASIIRRVLEHFGPRHRLMQYGIRSGTREEYQWMKNNGTLFSSKAGFLEELDRVVSSKPIYVTLDLDYFDPACLPGTGTPEPGGEDFSSFIQLIKRLKNKNFVGVDVTELAPCIDPTRNSSVFAAKVIRELLLALDLNRMVK